jgi:hypothetical protein
MERTDTPVSVEGNLSTEVTTSDGDDPYACKQTEDGHFVPDGGQFLSAIWVRCNLQGNFRLHRFLLAYNLCFLPFVGMLFWAVFLLQSIF